MTVLVYLGRGAKEQGLALGKLLGEGASGKVYAVPAMAGFAAKLYHDEAECRKHEAKIDLMLANPPDLPALIHQNRSFSQIAWPEAKLYDRTGRFIGFLMPEIDFARSTSLVNLLQKNSRRAEKISEYYGYRVLVARNLASVFAELHRAGHHMIDMKPANLRFYPQMSWMAVVDTDGFSIAGAHRRVPAEQVSDEYIAPESWRKKPVELGEEQDRFALAVIIFQLLDNGVHPFAGSATPGASHATDLQARIQEGLYPYAMKPNPMLTPSTASIHRSFRRATRGLFDRAFQPGQQRPSAEEWRDHLDELVDGLVPCPAKPQEHAHFGGGCGFCGHEARIEAAARVAKPRPQPRPPARTPPRPPGQPMGASASNVVRLPVTPRRIPLRQPLPGPRSGVPVPAHRLTMPRAAFQWWHAWPLVLLAALLVISSDELWRRISPAAADGLRAAGLMAVASPAAPPSVVAYAEPHDYRIRATRSGGGVALRDGPGDSYPVLQRLKLHEDVIGRGETQGDDGSKWVLVTRDSDGATGYVHSAALLLAPNSVLPAAACGSDSSGDKELEGCKDPQGTSIERAMLLRYRSLLDRAPPFDRIYLIEDHQYWLDQRADCRRRVEQVQPCIAELDRKRYETLHNWKGSDSELAKSIDPSDGDSPASGKPSL